MREKNHSQEQDQETCSKIARREPRIRRRQMKRQERKQWHIIAEYKNIERSTSIAPERTEAKDR